VLFFSFYPQHRLCNVNIKRKNQSVIKLRDIEIDRIDEATVNSAADLTLFGKDLFLIIAANYSSIIYISDPDTSHNSGA
jgi:hypothetical protein